jgi:hypothetical protein
MFFFCAACAVWATGAVFASMLAASADTANSDISSAGQVLDYAMQFRALPRTGNAAPRSEDPLGALSQITDALGLRDRIRQLQSNTSGVVLQVEKMFGGELGELLYSAENRGLAVKTAEIRALPGEGSRILSVTLMMDPR